MLRAHILHNVFINFVPSNTDGTADDDATQRENSNFRCATTNIDHHTAASFSHRQSCANCSSDGFFDEEYAPCPSIDGSVRLDVSELRKPHPKSGDVISVKERDWHRFQDRYVVDHGYTRPNKAFLILHYGEQYR